MNNLVSIIIPTYNRANLVCEAVESVLNQTYKDVEIIVVDDGSTDKTKEMLSKFDSKIIYIYQQNKGLPSARNAGIYSAKGQYIAFLDSDDLWLKEKLEVQMEFLRNNPEVTFLYTDAFRFLGNKILDGTVFDFVKPVSTKQSKNVLNFLILKKPIHPSTVVVRKDCFYKVGFLMNLFG